MEDSNIVGLRMITITSIIIINVILTIMSFYIIHSIGIGLTVSIFINIFGWYLVFVLAKKWGLINDKNIRRD